MAAGIAILVQWNSSSKTGYKLAAFCFVSGSLFADSGRAVRQQAHRSIFCADYQMDAMLINAEPLAAGVDHGSRFGSAPNAENKPPSKVPKTESKPPVERVV